MLPEADPQRARRYLRDRIADDRRRRAAAAELERGPAPLALYYSGAWRWPLLYGADAVGGKRSA